MKKDIIQAIMDDKTVQFREIFGFMSDELKEWTDLDINKHVELYASLFTDDDSFIWRIKPHIIRCKVGLFKDETNFMYADLIREYAFERTESDNESFVRWLIDVIEYNEKL